MVGSFQHSNVVVVVCASGVCVLVPSFSVVVPMPATQRPSLLLPVVRTTTPPRTATFVRSLIIIGIILTIRSVVQRPTRKMGTVVTCATAFFRVPPTVLRRRTSQTIVLRRVVSSFLVVRGGIPFDSTTTTRIPSLPPPPFTTRDDSSSSTTTTPLLLPHLEFVSSTPTTTTVPHHGPRVVIFLHGLLGNKRNFASMGRSLASSSSRVIYSLDLRHHGDSYLAHNHKTSFDENTVTATNTDDMSYRTMAQDVIHFCNVHGIAQIDTLIGHSIGGKVAQ